MPDPLCRGSVRRAQTPLPILLPASIPAPAPQGHPGKHKVVPSLVWSLSMRPGTRSNEQSRKQAERKANKRKQLRKLVSHSCASQPKSKEGGSCKGHWKNSSDIICPHRARLAQREKNKLFTSWASQLGGWSTQGAGISCICHSQGSTNPSCLALASVTSALFSGPGKRAAAEGQVGPHQWTQEVVCPACMCKELAHPPPARLAGSHRAERRPSLPILGVPAGLMAPQSWPLAADQSLHPVGLSGFNPPFAPSNGLFASRVSA